MKKRSSAPFARENRAAVSLFSGALGLDVGLEQAGLSVKICQDVDAVCLATMKLNRRPALGGDVREIASETILERSNLKRGEPFLVCGGPPCQPFSTAGKRLGINDPRGSLFKDFVRILDFIRPRFFIMENVKGLFSAPLKTDGESEPSFAEGKNYLFDVKPRLALEFILEEFEKLGYKTICGLLDAINYGVPQFRERLILLGSRDSEEIFLPAPTHFARHQNADYRWKTLRSAIGDLDSVGECASFGAERSKYLEFVPEGGNWRDLPEDLIPVAMGGAYRSSGGKIGFYRRLAFDQPSPTLVTSPIQKASMLCHPTQTRPLSVREYARIQQFPDDWTFAGSVRRNIAKSETRFPSGWEKRLAKRCSPLRTVLLA